MNYVINYKTRRASKIVTQNAFFAFPRSCIGNVIILAAKIPRIKEIKNLSGGNGIQRKIMSFLIEK